jgi:ADP-ribose pyrophosphatase
MSEYRKVQKLNPWVSLVETKLSSDEQSYFHVKVPDYVFILAITPENEIPLVSQFRVPMNRYSLELPAGLIDVNESPRHAAIRELKEETGIENIGKLIELPKMTLDSGRIENLTHAFVALNVEKPTSISKLGELDTSWVTKNELLSLATSGKIDHMGQVALILWALTKKFI